MHTTNQLTRGSRIREDLTLLILKKVIGHDSETVQSKHHTWKLWSN